MSLKLTLTPFKKIFIKEVLFQLLEKLIRVILGVYVLKQLSNYLGPEDFGLYSFVETFLLTMYGLSLFGMDIVIVRKIKKNLNLSSNITNGFFSLLVISIIFFIISFLIAFLFFEDKKHYLFVVTFVILLNPLLISEYYFVSKNLIRISSVIKMVSFIVKSFLILIFVFYNLDLIFFICLFVLDFFLYSVISFICFRIYYTNFSLVFDLNIIYQTIKSAVHVFIFSLGALLFFKIDIIMIEILLDDFNLGIYSASMKIIMFMYFIPLILSNTLFPKILEISKTDIFTSSISKIYRISFYSSLAVFLLIFIFSESIILSIYGYPFEKSVDILKILSFNIVLISIGTIYQKVLFSINHDKSLLIRFLISLMVNICLNYFLIRVYNVKGAAYASILSLLFLEIIYDFFDKNLVKFHVFKLKSLFKNP